MQLLPYSPRHLLALIEDEEAFRNAFGFPPAAGLRSFIVSEEVSPAWLEQLHAQQAPDPWIHGFALVERSSRTVVGNVGFKGPPDGEGVVEIAYGIVPAFEGKGLATEAAAAAIEFAMKDRAVRRIRAHTLPEANPSTRVLEKCGFEWIGEVRDPEDGLVWRWELRR